MTVRVRLGGQSHPMNVLFLGLLLLGAGAAEGVPPIEGVVLDSSGSAVPDAAVRLEVSGVPVNEVRTANDGRFTFSR